MYYYNKNKDNYDDDDEKYKYIKKHTHIKSSYRMFINYSIIIFILLYLYYIIFK